MPAVDESVEYEQLNENIRFLADVRFKLLAVLPVAGAAAVYVLTQLGLAPEPAKEPANLAFVFGASLLGFVVTLGLTLYDQRNSELYNGLMHRARHIERARQLPRTPGYPDAKQEYAGQFLERPTPKRYLFFPAKHDYGLALIYGSILGAWWYPIVHSGLSLAAAKPVRHEIGLCLAGLFTLAFVSILLSLDREDTAAYRRAWARDHSGAA